MPLYEYVCDACGAAFEVEQEDSSAEEALECPVCHSHDTQKSLSLFSVYGYQPPEGSGCSNEGSGFS